MHKNNVSALAIKTVEQYIVSCMPQQKSNLRFIIEEIATATFGAMLCSHSKHEILKYLERINSIVLHDLNTKHIQLQEPPTIQ